MKTTALICEIVTILVQMFHTYWIMDYGSGLKKEATFLKIDVNPRAIQAWFFCGILDVSFFAAMIEGLLWWSYGSIAILTVVNILYVYNTVEDLKFNKKNIHKYSLRRQVVRYFNVLVINACMVVFAIIYASYQNA